jgi:uncharacterized protein
VAQGSRGVAPLEGVRFAQGGMKGERQIHPSCSSPPSGRAAAAPLSEAPPSTPPARKRKGPRPKHIPQRMCVACRGHEPKRGLYRIVRTPEGQVEPDPTGRRNGRGAYLCGQAACWEKALASGILARALNVEIDTETLDTLRRYAATLPLESATAKGAAPAIAQTEEGGH